MPEVSMPEVSMRRPGRFVGWLTTAVLLGWGLSWALPRLLGALAEVDWFRVRSVRIEGVRYLSAEEAERVADPGEARHSERGDRVAQQRAVLGEVGDHADPAVHVEGRDGREVGGREAAPHEVRGGAARALDARQVGERLVEQQQEAPARGRGDAQLVLLVRVGGVDVTERDDLGGPAVLLHLEVGGSQPAYGLAVLVDHEHGHQHQGHVGTEHRRRLGAWLFLGGNERSEDQSRQAEHESTKFQGSPLLR